ncbi:palmitoyltransferase ZDHHC3/7/25 [Nematocida minor]|uniref:palmitoyltransferase ZDHHC3/7/25 n=1 Tax=Nematocida minor TaxID=1912983 RepID=UPI00221E4C51|nr:palmitoyltransferase ZDHHC3/7/25 [Nematocida minor]KAI5189176.1 palmitoyltransferase ZDHHC3/7/25 [Nematocida minor]
MYFSNRSYMDKVGLSLTYSLIMYIGVFSGPVFLWNDLKNWHITRTCLAILNGLVVLDLVLLIFVSSTRGYVKEEEYVPGGKFCYECRKAKPERAHHCSRCKKCINRMDHHCPWVGSCINASNLGNFIKLIFSILMSSLMALFLHGYVFHLKIRLFYDSIEIKPSLCVISVNIIILILVATGLLFIFIRQMKFLLANVTYLEYLQIKKLNEIGVIEPRNPYDKGVLGNLKIALGSPLGFLACREPEDAKVFGYKNYWPPLRMSRSMSSSQIALNSSIADRI